MDKSWDVGNFIRAHAGIEYRQRLGTDDFPHLTALKAAGDYFGLNPRDIYELEILAQIMAYELFGPRKKGRPHGKDFWTQQVLFSLGARRYELKRGDKSLTEEQIAEIISKEEPFRAAYKDRPEQIRQHLPAARREYSEFLEEQRSEALWDAYYGREDDGDDRRDEYE